MFLPYNYTFKPSTFKPSKIQTIVKYLIRLALVSFIFGGALPVHAQTPTASRCLQQGGRIETSNVRSSLLTLPMEYRVYLPPCYAEQPERRYPVLYLFHGSNYNDDQWDRLGIDETADHLIEAGEIPPLIIVMPRDRNWSDPPIDAFGKVVVEQLVPLIDKNYRTIAAREGRAVGGLSRGAGWAVHLGLESWKLFSSLGAHSLPVFWSDTGKVRSWLAQIPVEQRPRIYLDIGDKDRESILNSAVWFEKLLTRLSIPHEWRMFSGYHEEAYWQKHLEQYLRWYSEGWSGSGY